MLNLWCRAEILPAQVEVRTDSVAHPESTHEISLEANARTSCRPFRGNVQPSLARCLPFLRANILTNPCRTANAKFSAKCAHCRGMRASGTGPGLRRMTGASDRRGGFHQEGWDPLACPAVSTSSSLRHTPVFGDAAALGFAVCLVERRGRAHGRPAPARKIQSERVIRTQGPTCGCGTLVWLVPCRRGDRKAAGVDRPPSGHGGSHPGATAARLPCLGHPRNRRHGRHGARLG